MTSTLDSNIKKVKIQTGVVKRIVKERSSYVNETEKENTKYEAYLVDPNKDDHERRKQKEIVDECQRMIPDCDRRLIKAYDDIKSALEAAKESVSGDRSTWSADVRKIVEEAEQILSKKGE